MQRLFSTFPGSWPGLGLLLLRVTVALFPLAFLATPLPSLGPVSGGPVLGLIVLLEVCVMLGFATPLTSPLLAVTAIAAGRDLAWGTWLAMTGISLSLMLAGPGAWSVDARIYGRKRIDIGRG